MLVMFGVGVGNLAAMAALTGAMVIEKTVPGGKRLSPVIGIMLLLLGACGSHILSGFRGQTYSG